jgi:hypothetical protein
MLPVVIAAAVYDAICGEKPGRPKEEMGDGDGGPVSGRPIAW